MRAGILSGLGLILIGSALYSFRSPLNVRETNVPDCPNCNIVFILIDTLRADHLPFYGYSRQTAPFLESFAERSILFQHAYSASSWTVPAVASIFTSRFPSQHGLAWTVSAMKARGRSNPEIVLKGLSSSVETLPEIMAQQDYFTIGISDNVHIGSELGFERGFKLFGKANYGRAPSVRARVDDYLARRDPRRPYFLYLHFMEPHRPYGKHEPWYSECLTEAPSGEQQRDICAYDSSIRFLDGEIASLVANYSWLENSIIILTSDHGEEFGDHGGSGHGHTLYRELIHVPLIVYHPKLGGKVLRENVHTMDLLPTLAALTGRTIDKTWQGKSLVPPLTGKSDSLEIRQIWSELIDRPGRWRSLIDEQWHYLESEQRKEATKEELYDLQQDREERKNLARINNETADALRQTLHDLRRKHTTTVNPEEKETTTPANKKTLEHLRSLGYL